jgi:hypothetical protein
MHREHGRIRGNGRWWLDGLRPVCDRRRLRGLSGRGRSLLRLLGLCLSQYGRDNQHTHERQMTDHCGQINLD